MSAAAGPPEGTGSAGTRKVVWAARVVVANLFGVAGALAVPAAVVVCVVALLGLVGWWPAVGLALLVLTARPAGEMAAEAVCRVEEFPPPRWWACRVAAAAALAGAGFLVVAGGGA